MMEGVTAPIMVGAAAPMLGAIAPMNLAWLGADGQVHSINEKNMLKGSSGPHLLGASAPMMVGTSAATYSPVNLI